MLPGVAVSDRSGSSTCQHLNPSTRGSEMMVGEGMKAIMYIVKRVAGTRSEG